MNLLKRSLIEKTGHDNGFEHVLGQDAEFVTLASALHKARVMVSVLTMEGFNVLFQPASPALLPELSRSFPEALAGGSTDSFHVASLKELAPLLRRAASLSKALPSQAEQDYQLAVSHELAKLPPTLGKTEVELLVRQRVGQTYFRGAMMSYWGSSCALTGVNVPEVLRASHAKPWAECESDAERLDVFNGFLLTANVDALFDRFLISFDEDGCLEASPCLTEDQLSALGIAPGMKLRWLAPEHQHYLSFHHDRFLITAHGALTQPHMPA